MISSAGRGMAIMVTAAALVTVGSSTALAANWARSAGGTGSVVAASLTAPSATGSTNQANAVAVTWPVPPAGTANRATTYFVNGAGSCSAPATAGGCIVSGLDDAAAQRSFSIRAAIVGAPNAWQSGSASFSGATIAPVSATPAPPTNLRITSCSYDKDTKTGTFVLAWTVSADTATAQRIYRGTTAPATFAEEIADNTTATSTQTVGSLSNNTEMHFSVSAKNSAGESAKRQSSNKAEVTNGSGQGSTGVCTIS